MSFIPEVRSGLDSCRRSFVYVPLIRAYGNILMMAQVTIYLRDAIAAAAKQRAKRSGKSMSAWITDVLERELGAKKWPPALIELLTHGSGDLVEPEDPPPEDEEIVR